MSTKWNDRYNKLTGYEKLCFHAVQSEDSGYPEYYFETGRYKPWKVQTLHAAERRGLVESVKNHKPVYLVTVSEKGRELGKEVAEKLKG